MKFDKLLWVLALLGLCVTSCKKEEEDNEGKAPKMTTKYYTIGSGASSAGCYLSLANDSVYGIPEEEVQTANNEYLKQVDIIFDGTKFFSPSSSSNPTIQKNGIQTHVNEFEDGFFFETSEGYYGYIYFEEQKKLGDPKHNYKIRVEYKKRATPSAHIDETIGSSYIIATDTFNVVIGSKNSPITPYFSIKLKDSVNVNDTDKMQYVDFYQGQEDTDLKEINLKVPDTKLNVNATLNTIQLEKEGLYRYSTGMVNKYTSYEGTIKVLLTSYAGNIYEEGICIIWKLEVTRTGIRLQ